MNWRPAHVKRFRIRSRPAIGDVVAYDRRAWEVLDVADTEPTPYEQERLVDKELLPYRVTLRRLHGPPHEHENDRSEVAARVVANAFDPLPEYPDGRVPLCSCHGHPWPCLEADQQLLAEKELKEAEKVLALLPGCCPACDEPVTSRQRSITFAGPNVRNPLADGPTFHLRRKCRREAARYEEAWVAADPTRKRSLLTLYCEGTVTVHGDGTGECFGADGSDCPSIYANHRGVAACYFLSHGCGRGCTPAGHPGTRLAGRPADPREVS